ncbi:MAG: DUF928 domain-containing protein [Symploca sp. SIO3E6]|nr:DUF928 domain-containing protein [Caldora sp. SIO3E6]
MTLIKWSQQRITLIFPLTVVLVGFIGGFRGLWAEPAWAIAINPSQPVLEFEPPNDGAPGDREDAGSRPGCPKQEKPFTALVPATNLGVTVAAYPTFWLYMPYRSGSVELVLEDEDTKNRVYQTRFQVKDGAGIISFRLPETAPPLEIGKKYRWRFFFFCKPARESDFLAVNGVIKREPLTAMLRSQLEQVSPRERVALYAKNGWWHETFTELAELRRAKPQDSSLAANWAKLLKHPLVGLDEIVSEPLVPCCKSE